MGWLKKLKEGLFKSSSKINEGIDEVFEAAEAAPESTPESKPEPEAPKAEEVAEEIAVEEALVQAPPEPEPEPEIIEKTPEPEPEVIKEKAPEPAPVVQEKKPEPEPQPKSEPKPELKAEKKPEPKIEVKAEPKPESKPQPKEEPKAKKEEKTSLVGRFFKKSAAVITKRKLDDAMLEQLEEVLIGADMGVNVAAELTTALAKDRFDKEVTPDEVKTTLAEKITEILAPVAKPLEVDAAKPFVILTVGVNGNGKTTTLGKLTHQLKGEGKKVMLAACDTFRAAAVEQLSEWGKRTGTEVITGAPQADPGSVAYKALEQAKAKGVDVLLIDTAGRLQNKAELMEELAKVVRVLKKQDESVPHATVLVLDATTGQNAHSQVEIFKEKVNITGLVVTKLDGTAKGGVVVALAKRFNLPIHAVGVGESLEDLKPFRAEDFARSLMGLNDA